MNKQKQNNNNWPSLGTAYRSPLVAVLRCFFWWASFFIVLYFFRWASFFFAVFLGGGCPLFVCVVFCVFFLFCVVIFLGGALIFVCFFVNVLRCFLFWCLSGAHVFRSLFCFFVLVPFRRAFSLFVSIVFFFF